MTNRSSTPSDFHPDPNSLRARRLDGQEASDSTARRIVTVLEPRLLVPVSKVQAYLNVSPLAARAVLRDLQIKPVLGKRYDLRDVWFALWGIRNVCPREPNRKVEIRQSNHDIEGRLAFSLIQPT